MSLKKIAEMTGVSISTVSRVLNNKDYNCASDEVKNRIWEAAKEIQYVPNESARQLQKGGSEKPQGQRAARKIIVILGRFQSIHDDPFFEELFRSVEQEIFAQGCSIQAIIPSEELLRGEVPDTDGFLILGRSSRELLRVLEKKTKNLAAVNRNPTMFEIDEVICDGKKAAETAVGYLLEKGHEKIGYIGDCSYEARYIGYYETLVSHHLPIDYACIYPTGQTEQEGYEAMRELLDRGQVTAVLCANDATALGGLRAYNEAEQKNKTDIISIDNIRAAETVQPLLTTVHIPEKDMGRAAVRMLIDRMNKGHQEKMRIEFPSRLVRRESC